MMMSLRYASSKLLLPLQQRSQQQAARSMTILSKESAEEYKKLDYTERQKKTGRPVSPHVTIYAMPITALSSITNRVTGIGLSFGCFGLGFAELVGGSGTALDLMQTVGSGGFLLGTAAKFTVSFPLIYHFGGGVRHLFWDSTPDALTNPGVEKLSYQLVGGSLATAGILSLFF